MGVNGAVPKGGKGIIIIIITNLISGESFMVYFKYQNFPSSMTKENEYWEDTKIYAIHLWVGGLLFVCL